MAFETGRKYGIRVNTISAGTAIALHMFYSIRTITKLLDNTVLIYLENGPGPLKSRAAKVTGLVEKFIDYSFENAPLQKELFAGQCESPAGTIDRFLFWKPC